MPVGRYREDWAHFRIGVDSIRTTALSISEPPDSAKKAREAYGKDLPTTPSPPASSRDGRRPRLSRLWKRSSSPFENREA
jgi:hypothetical protein